MDNLKRLMFGKISIILCLCLVLNNIFIIKSYADDAIVTDNPLFIPITTFVTAGLIGSGMIAKNSQDALNAGGQLVDDIITQIKSSEVAKSESDAGYDSPYRVINGGQPEKPNNNNKNGKWVAVAGGALAGNEIYANKEAIKDIMSKANSLGGYNQQTISSGFVSADKFKSTANLSNVSLQLANISNSALSQFDQFIHSDTWLSQGVSSDDCYFAVNVYLPDIISNVPIYPRIQVRIYQTEQNIKSLNIIKNLYSYGQYSNSYGSLYRYFPNGNTNGIYFLNDDDVNFSMNCWRYQISARQSGENLTVTGGKLSGQNNYDVTVSSFANGLSAFCGYVGIVQNPIQFTNNVYNVNMTFDENFQQWVQGQIQGLGGQLIDAVRLGLTSINSSWNPTQEQIQQGTSPSSVIYQFINNYENPENIPEDEVDPNPNPNPNPNPEADNEYKPDSTFLDSFMLPSLITTKFPFCIPFDVARALSLFDTNQREAPVWECDLHYGTNVYHMVIDLSQFDDVASFLRSLEFILFVVGLAVSTRSIIRG